MNSLINKINELIMTKRKRGKCQICLQTMKSDNILKLSCGHTFDDSCINGLFRTSGTDRCPICLKKHEICSICHDVMNSDSNIKKLSCRHRFDDECINKWFQTSRIRKCPICFKMHKDFDIRIIFSMLSFIAFGLMLIALFTVQDTKYESCVDNFSKIQTQCIIKNVKKRVEIGNRFNATLYEESEVSIIYPVNNESDYYIRDKDDYYFSILSTRIFIFIEKILFLPKQSICYYDGKSKPIRAFFGSMCFHNLFIPTIVVELMGIVSNLMMWHKEISIIKGKIMRWLFF